MEDSINNNIPESDEQPKNEAEEIRELIRKNYELTQEIYEMTRKIKSYITFQKIMSFIYLILIVGPIILSFVYLPSLLKNALGPYQDLLKESGTNMDLQSILKSLGK